MTTTTALMLVVLLAVTSAVSAEDRKLVSDGLLAAERQQWRELNANMSTEEYKEVYRHNRRLVRDRLKDTAVSLGIPKSGVVLMGAAIRPWEGCNAV